MASENNQKNISSQVMELKDLISGPLVATIDADTISTRRYLSYLIELAFEEYDKETGKGGKLRTLDFTFTSQDVNGTSAKNQHSAADPCPASSVAGKRSGFRFRHTGR